MRSRCSGKGLGWLLLSWLTLLLLAPTAGAGTPTSLRKQVESSLLVAGMLDIETDGSVLAVAIEHQDKLPPAVVTLVRDSARKWRFEPTVVEGQAVRARSPMLVRLVANKLDNGDYQIALRSASFEHNDLDDHSILGRIEMGPPRYPEIAFRNGVGGNVYLLLKVGRDGTVQDVVAEQVNLRVLGSAPQMRRFRDALADAALVAARKWKFRPPSEGKQAQAPFWTARVPVGYTVGSQHAEGEPGRWTSYVPGPRHRPDWFNDSDEIGFSPDALAEGGIYMAERNGPRLLTPLHGG